MSNSENSNSNTNVVLSDMQFFIIVHVDMSQWMFK